MRGHAEPSLEAALGAAARASDGTEFAQLIERYRAELQLHCYRIVGSLEEAEDLVQDTFLRAWSKRRSFQSRSTVRAWLYGIATNACLDGLGAASGASCLPTWRLRPTRQRRRCRRSTCRGSSPIPNGCSTTSRPASPGPTPC